jgi:quercetin dioxygenase-like cupin family protein
MVIEGSDVFVKETELAPGDTMPFHHHSTVVDIFYCLKGELSIDQADIFTGEAVATVTLAAGDSITIKPGTAHRPHNRSSNDTRFLLIQGVGEYDYILYNTV